MKDMPIRQLSLVKGEERFIFRYISGQEQDLLDSMAKLAANREYTFDWFDAAVLSYQMGRIPKGLEEKV